MEQLTNMPIWAQLLSMGSFMFASGILMTRIPLAPILILSFFYLYGSFNTMNSLPSFTLQHPWIITMLHVAIPLLCGVFAFWVVLRPGPGDAHWFDGIWILLGLIPLVIGMLVSLVVAVIKFYQFVAATPVAKCVCAVALVCLVIGVVVGIMDWYFCFFQPGSYWGSGIIYRLIIFLSVAVVSVLMCVGGISAIVYNKPGFLLIGFILFIVATIALEYMTPGWSNFIYERKVAIYEPLHESCRNGDLNEVKAWLAKNKGRNLDYHHGEALFQAVINGHSEIVKELIAAGADVNQKRDNGWTILQVAWDNGDDEIVEILKSAGAKE